MTMKWTLTDVLIVALISLAMLCLHSYLQFHPPFPEGAVTFLETQGFWGPKVKSAPIKRD